MDSKFIIVLLQVTFAVLPAIHVKAAGDVLVLTDSDFASRIADEGLTLVKFYAPWCGHCKEIAPEFEKAATALKNNDPPVILAEVDCVGEGKETCGEEGVNGYPTLKAYKRGQKVFDYDGPRDADGIVKHMQSKSGPASKELTSVMRAVQFLDDTEHSIIGFFKSADDVASKQFQKLASALSDEFRFAHTFHPDVRAKYYDNDVVIFQPKRLVTKMEPDQLRYPGFDTFDMDHAINWVYENIHGLAGHRTLSNSHHFKSPIIVVYCDIDFERNPKGSNYWRNRVMKVAENIANSGRKLRFAISSSDEMIDELSEFGLSDVGKKPVVTGLDADEQKFVMKEEFSLEALEKFASDMFDGKLDSYLKSEPIPPDSKQNVKVVVAKQFNMIVNDPTKDVLIEFYAPWCGHCKSLAPKYEELADKMKDEESIVIAKMDATSNDVPKQYDVQGFPTIYFVPKDSKKSPRKYEGPREVNDFISYLAQHSTEPLQGYTRDGKKIKAKTEL